MIKTVIYIVGLVTVVYLVFNGFSSFLEGNQTILNALAWIGFTTICLMPILYLFFKQKHPEKVRIATAIILGGNLKDSIHEFITKLPQLEKNTTAKLITALIYRFTRVVTIGLIVTLLPTFLLFIQNGKIQSQNNLIEDQTKLLRAQNELITNQLQLEDASRRAGLVELFSSVLDEMSRELDENADRQLSEQLIARIKYLSNSLKPYTYFENGTRVRLSPERGQLFSIIVSSGIGKESLDEIFRMTTFEYADLRGFKFHDLMIQNVKLNHANLDGTMFHQCEFSHTTFDKANLNNCLFQYSTFNYCSFEDVSLRQAVFKNDSISNTRFLSVAADSSTWENIFLKDSRLIKVNFHESRIDRIEYHNVALVQSSFEDTKGSVLNFSNLIVLENDYLKWNEVETNSIFKSINDRVLVNHALKQYKRGYHHFLFYEVNNEGQKKVRAYDMDLDSVQSILLILNEQ